MCFQIWGCTTTDPPEPFCVQRCSALAHAAQQSAVCICLELVKENSFQAQIVAIKCKPVCRFVAESRVDVQAGTVCRSDAVGPLGAYNSVKLVHLQQWDKWEY